MRALFILFVLISFNLFADEYKAPGVKLGLHPHSEPSVKGKLNWANDNYKFQDVQDKDRALASEEDEKDDSTMRGRNPSSDLVNKSGSQVDYWKWDQVPTKD